MELRSPWRPPGRSLQKKTINQVAYAFSGLCTKTDTARISLASAREILAKKQQSTGWFMLFPVCLRRPTQLGSPWRPPGRSSQKNNNQPGGLCFFPSAYEDRQSSELVYEDRRSLDLPGVCQRDPRIKTIINRVFYTFSGLRTKTNRARSFVRMCQRLLCWQRISFYSHHFHHVLLAENLGARIFFPHPFHHCWQQIWECVSFFSHPFHHLLLAAKLGVNYLSEVEN